jgi:hypothetical protein
MQGLPSLHELVFGLFAGGIRAGSPDRASLGAFGLGIRTHAFGAFCRINYKRGIALFNCSIRALGFASAAADTIVTDFISHVDFLLIFFLSLIYFIL